MDRIRQTARALCCCGTPAHPAALPGSSSERGSFRQSSSSVGALSSSTASGQARRQQIAGSQGSGSPTATTGDVVAAAVDVPLSTSPASEDPTALVAVPVSPLSTEGTADSNVARLPQPGTQMSTPSSLTYSDAFQTSSGSSSTDLSSLLHDLGLIDARAVSTPSNFPDQWLSQSPAAAASPTYPDQSASQGSALSPLQLGDNRAGRSEPVLVDLPRNTQQNQHRVVTWQNLFENIPEHDTFAPNHPAYGEDNPLTGLSVFNLPPPRRMPAVPAAAGIGVSPVSVATDQLNNASLPLMPQAQDADAPSRRLAMRLRQHTLDAEDEFKRDMHEEELWPVMPPPSPSSSTGNEGVSRGSSSTGAGTTDGTGSGTSEGKSTGSSK